MSLLSEIAEVYELRIVLEGHLLECAGQRLDEETLDRLQPIADGVEDLPARLHQRRLFRQALYERAGRPRALVEAGKLWDSVER